MHTMIVQHTVVKTPNFTNFNKNHFSPKYKNVYFYMSFLVQEIEKSSFFFFFVTRHFANAALCQCTLPTHFANALCQGSTLPWHAYRHFAKDRHTRTLPMTGTLSSTLSGHAGRHFIRADRHAFCQDVSMILWVWQSARPPGALQSADIKKSSFDLSLLYQNCDIVLRSFFTVLKFQCDFFLYCIKTATSSFDLSLL